MRRLFAPLLCAALFAVVPSWAATGLDAARTSASAARVKLNEIRSRQMELRMELNRVATRIEELKSARNEALLPGSDLETALRRSQELSGALTEAAQAFSSAQAELDQHNLVLLSALNQELEALRAQWDRLQDRAARQHAIDRMRALRAEREQVRAMLPAAKVPALGAARSDDPEDLLEQADALRDSEDKLRQKMKGLQARIAELRSERELDRRMNDFLGDEAIFDDQDRHLRRQRSPQEVRSEAGPVPTFGAPASADSASAPGGAGGGPTLGAPTVGAPSLVAPTQEPEPVVITQVARGMDARPQVSGGVDALLLESVDGGNLEALEAQLKKLKQLAQELDQRADEMEQRANELR